MERKMGVQMGWSGRVCSSRAVQRSPAQTMLCLTPNALEERPLADACAVGVADGVEEHAVERLGIGCASGGRRSPSLVDDGADDLDDQGGDGEVGLRAFLDVEDADLDGAAVEAGHRAAGVGELVAEDALGVERGEVVVERPRMSRSYSRG
jgi:hypothetical protein